MERLSDGLAREVRYNWAPGGIIMVLDRAVLVLSKSLIPVHLTTVRRAFCLLAKGHVRVVGPDYRFFTMEEWIAEEPAVEDEAVDTPRRRVLVPRVIVLTEFDRLPRREVKFSRRNVYLRDQGLCGYCGRHGRPEDMTLDHVQPVSRGGKSTWDNILLACRECNARKDNRTPEEAGMKMLRKPSRPTWMSFMILSARVVAHESWRPFAPHLFAQRAVA